MPMYMMIVLAALVAQAQPAPKNAAPADQDALQIQVMLDRAGFSPGALDGRMGSNTKKALAEYQKAGRTDAAPVEATTRYRITAADAAGPFVDVKGDVMAQSKLESLGYASLLEALSERFHSTPALLQHLNPGASFAADEEIVVPNVEAMVLPAPPPPKSDKPAEKRTRAEIDAENQAARERMAAKPAVTVTVTRSSSALTVTDSSGKVVFYAPVTTGSEKDPLPIGEWKVNGVQLNPTFRYNPDLFWDADPSHTKALLQAGPNNPVGLVWVDISKDHYGLHGTPEPAAIGRSESHGCVRLTNWDAMRLAGLVKPGTPVIFKE
jgi:lipoprotein-anchoring transpeptidase ErfK/SrfK